MLSHDEELWEKELPPAVETLLLAGKDPLADRSDRSKGAEKSEKRDKTKVVTFRVPHNAAVQIYDYKEKKARYRNYLRLINLTQNWHVYVWKCKNSSNAL